MTGLGFWGGWLGLWRDDWAGALGWLTLMGYRILSSWITGLKARGLANVVILSAVKDLSILAADPIQLLPLQPLAETLR